MVDVTFNPRSQNPSRSVVRSWLWLACGAMMAGGLAVLLVPFALFVLSGETGSEAPDGTSMAVALACLMVAVTPFVAAVVSFVTASIISKDAHVARRHAALWLAAPSAAVIPIAATFTGFL